MKYRHPSREPPESPIYNLSKKRIWVAGHNGMVGAALVRRLQSENCEILTTPRTVVDLMRQTDVERWLEDHKPHAVIVAAAKVGGIAANATYPAEFLYDNLMIEANIIRAAHDAGVEKLLFLGSSCIYPKFAPQPITEEDLLTGSLEPTNEWYAIAKIAGIKLCQAFRAQYGCDFISAMPTNLYGPNDNFSLETSHVIPALLRKADNAKREGADHLTMWGSGTPRREFLHVDDCADALIHLLKHYSGMGHINVGTGTDVTIEDVTRLIAKIVGFQGRIEKDLSKPDGTPRKLMSNAKLAAMGWQPRLTLEDGLRGTYAWYRATLTENEASLRR